MLETARNYVEQAVATIQRVMDTQAGAIDQTAAWIAESILAGGVLHVFGSGHSHEMVEEMTFRAGGLAPVNPILDINYTLMGGPPTFSSRLERLEGYARALIENYDLREAEVIIINSQSGINPGPLDMALAARERGLKVVAITSMQQSQQSVSRHSSGKRLFEVADLVIDNCILPGDACIALGPGLPNAAPLSTVVTATIMQSIVAEVAVRIRDAGQVPPLWVSANLPQGDAHNNGLMNRYPSRKKPF